MDEYKRRDFLKTTAGVAATTALGGGTALFAADAAAQQYNAKPEKGAKLRVLRWKRFVQGDEDVWLANTKKFTQMTGVEVRVDAEGWEDVRPKAAVAANVGSGPDIIISTMEDAHLYPDKLVDVSDLANYLGKKYGGWYQAAKDYGMDGKRWVAIMMGAAGNAMVVRKSMMNAAGFEQFPTDMPGFLKLCQALKAKNTPAGFALGNATGDSSWTSWLVWAFGGKLVDEHNKVVINSPQTLQALEYAKELYPNFIPGTLSWLDPNNNKAFLDGQLGADGQRHLGLLRGEELAGPEDEGDHAGHHPCQVPQRHRRQGGGAEPRVPDDDLQVLEVPERGQGIPALHDGEGAVRAVAGGVDRLRLPSARRVRVERVLDRRSQGHAVSRLHEGHAQQRLRRVDGLRLGAVLGRLHHPQHGGGGGIGREVAEGGDGEGAAAGGALLQGMTSRRNVAAARVTARATPYLSGLERHLRMTLNPDGRFGDARAGAGVICR